MYVLPVKKKAAAWKEMIGVEWEIVAKFCGMVIVFIDCWVSSLLLLLLRNPHWQHDFWVYIEEMT